MPINELIDVEDPNRLHGVLLAIVSTIGLVACRLSEDDRETLKKALWDQMDSQGIAAVHFERLSVQGGNREAKGRAEGILAGYKEVIDQLGQIF